MGQHRKIVLTNIDADDQPGLKAYEGRGGYQAIRKALALNPRAVLEEVRSSGLRGRGGAGFLCGQKWSFVPQSGSKPVYVVHNADESEPGTFKDRLLLERDPHLALEGTLICAWAIQSHWTCIYLRGEYAFAYSQVKRAVDEAYSMGYLGKNIFGSGFDHHISVHRGAGAYICGEETGLLESLEGRRGYPRLKPPFFPATIGLYGCPTVVNNTETLCTLVWIMNHGAAEYRKIGTEKSPGTRLISASGHINRPGVYEIEMGYPIMRFIEEECGGVWKGRKLKAVIPGGTSVPVLRAEELKGVNLDFESLEKCGSALGSGGFIVMDETTDMVDVALNVARFYAEESCGQCTPCREGAHWIEKIFRRISEGCGCPEDIGLVQDICGQIGRHTVCAFGEALAWPAKAFVEKFRDEFEARIRLGCRDAAQPSSRQTHAQQ